MVFLVFFFLNLMLLPHPTKAFSVKILPAVFSVLCINLHYTDTQFCSSLYNQSLPFFLRKQSTFAFMQGHFRELT